ncbi:MAG TPA: hypothetical protein VKV73_07100 [Chloroflexota bacterium]|nr:hypothetical protein [Chloroflexota bacterium]
MLQLATMERFTSTPFPAYVYAQRAAAGQLAARASSASAVLAASAAPGAYTLALLGRRAAQPLSEATRRAA